VTATRPAEQTPFHEAWRWLVSLRPRGIKLGLDRVRAALSALGDPHKKLTAVIVGGTNGKGSTSQMLAAIGHAANYRVGLYTSPHLIDVTERIVVGGVRISAADFSRLARRVRGVTEGDSPGDTPIPLTFFEVLTVMALVYFAEREVDFAVLEVGLGGRLDATTVVTPKVAVLTNVALDHQDYLGTTLDAIAQEKVGILAEGTTLVTAVDKRLFRDVVGPHAFELRCPIRRLGVDFQARWLSNGFRYRGWLQSVGPVRLGIRGVHQGENAALACAAAESLGAHGFHFKAVHLAEGMMRARHPGRLERRPPSVGGHGETWPALLLDGAHNPAGAGALASHIGSFLPERPRVMVFGVNPDKDVSGMLEPLAPHVDAIVLTASSVRPVTGWATYLAMASRCHDHVAVEPDAWQALVTGRELAGPEGGLLVCGSLYLLGQLWTRLPDARP
jgi:dihydrofolate synthase/folylpolyglutamate synthase